MYGVCICLGTYVAPSASVWRAACANQWPRLLRSPFSSSSFVIWDDNMWKPFSSGQTNANQFTVVFKVWCLLRDTGPTHQHLLWFILQFWLRSLVNVEPLRPLRLWCGWWGCGCGGGEGVGSKITTQTQHTFISIKHTTQILRASTHTTPITVLCVCLFLLFVLHCCFSDVSGANKIF